MRHPQYLLALDQGTTSSRAIVFDRSGTAVASAQKSLRQTYPRPGWVEHDPVEIWSDQCAMAAEAINRARLTDADIAAVGVTNQRETAVVWDHETGIPIHPAIVWQDRRTTDICTRLKAEGAEPLVTAKTGLRLDPYFSATKIAWILDHVAGARRRAEQGHLRCGTIDTWLVWHLTNRKAHVTDASNASRTSLYNLHIGDWDDDLLALFGVPRVMLPEVRSSAEIYGRVSRHFHPAGVPIAGIAGDQQAALFGQGCFKAGMAKSTYGTGCFLLMHTGTEIVTSHNNLLTTVAWKIGARTEYALEGAVFIGGAVVQWLRDELKLVRDVDELNTLAGSVRDAGGLFLVPAFAGLGAPHWDPHARGTAVGITRGTNRAHFCRAALEAIAFQTADLITCMERDSRLTLKELRVDGGAARSELLLQFQADLLGVPVLRPKNIESTAKGAALLAGLGVGFWKSRDDLTRSQIMDSVINPIRTRIEMRAKRLGWEKALERAKAWEESA